MRVSISSDLISRVNNEEQTTKLTDNSHSQKTDNITIHEPSFALGPKSLQVLPVLNRRNQN